VAKCFSLFTSLWGRIFTAGYSSDGAGLLKNFSTASRSLKRSLAARKDDGQVREKWLCPAEEGGKIA
jgi:hypothetical protein